MAFNRVITSAGNFDADIVILSLGIRPNTTFFSGSGIEMEKSAIIVDDIPGIAKDEKLLLVCTRGLLQNRLKTAGYTNTRVLEGGMTVNKGF